MGTLRLCTFSGIRVTFRSRSSSTRLRFVFWSWYLSRYLMLVQNAQIMNNKHWKEVCGTKSTFVAAAEETVLDAGIGGFLGALLALFLFVGMLAIGKRVRKRRAQKKVQLIGEEVSDYGSIYAYGFPIRGTEVK